MAEVPSDVSWPPGSAVDFDSIFDELIRLKEHHYPEHTARDLADPLIQILTLIASMGQHGLGMVNQALLNISPKTAVSRAALISVLEIVNRPLLPIQPARGAYFARLKSLTHSSGDVLVAQGQKIAAQGISDPSFSTDELVAWPDDDSVHVVHFDEALDTTTEMTLPDTWNLASGDFLVFSFSTLAFDSIALVVSGLSSACSLSVEFENEEYGSVDAVTDLGSTLQFTVDEYLFAGEATGPTGLEATVRYKPTGITDTGTVALVSGSLVVETGFLGQVSPSTSPSDYEVLTGWRPVRNVDDGTDGLSGSGSIAFSITDVFDEDARWIQDDLGTFRIRIRILGMGGNSDPSSFTMTSAALDNNAYAVSAVTQGIRQTNTLGLTDGTKFQFMPVATQPLYEPIIVPRVGITVDADTEWSVVDDFSNSDPTSKHAIFREDPDSGWGIVFGDGTVGQVPADGSSVRITYRTGSSSPGNIDPTAELRALGGSGQADTYTFYRGTDGFHPAEASDRDSVMLFRAAILPQLALRADSSITRDEIVTAMSGGAPNRATFTTSDGRSPFSRAAFTLEGAGDRQYVVIVVGSESTPDGSVASTDVDEAEEWLNGTEVGIEIIGGHGPNNTEGIVVPFSPRLLKPTVTVTIANRRGVKDTVERIVRDFFRPHARDEDEAFRWSFGGRVPIANLFSLLWAALPGRVFIEISVSDGVTVYGSGDYVQLLETELPVLDPDFDPATDVAFAVVT